MSHPVCYTYSMIIKTDMKNKNEKASNLILGAIYINATTGAPCRLVHIVPCQGVWLETFDGEGYGDLVKFEDCHYADIDEVKDFLQDLEVFNGKDKAPSHKSFMDSESCSYSMNTLWGVQGYYDDDEGNDIRCRD